MWYPHPMEFRGTSVDEYRSQSTWLEISLTKQVALILHDVVFFHWQNRIKLVLFHRVVAKIK